MKKAVMAGIVSLFLVGMTGAAHGESPASKPDAEPGVVKLFGQTLCLASAPAEAKCDWRIPRLAQTSEAAAAKERKPTVLRLFGLNWCFGDVSPESHCELKLPMPADERRRARL